jgi:segregation and condensation protein A
MAADLSESSAAPLENISVEPAVEAADHPQNATQAPISGSTFPIHMENFEGPFDLLLSLISKHKLDITEIALGVVTDEFINYIRSQEANGADLDELTEFLVVAATLLDLKAARLLPSGEVEDEEDLALLEARDLLFARLLQYRAFKEVAALIAQKIGLAERYFPRSVSLEPQFTTLLPEVLIGVGPQRFAAIAGRALSPKKPAVVSVEHIHRPLVSVAEEAEKVVSYLREHKKATFRSLIGETQEILIIVARFLSLLELYREGSVRFEQVQALGELFITWTGSESGEIQISDEFDNPPIVEEETSEE